MSEEFKSAQPIIERPTPIDKEVDWDKSKIIISETDTFGTITNVNEVFVEVSGYTANELIGQPHNLIRHPDVPKLVYKILWDNLKVGNNFAGVVKNLAKSGDYYWVITDFEMRRDGMGNITHYIAKRKAAPQNVVDYVSSLYETLVKLEKIGGMELSTRFFKNFLDKQGKDYMDFIIGLLEENKEEVAEATEMATMTFENKEGDTISDEIYQVKDTMNEKRKNFFERLFS
ncbi:MAG: PAS domain-containing protein [Capnocytophaga sp.]|nr:PAS domain-containing protein [Capnocytophaga sp.]